MDYKHMQYQTCRVGDPDPHDEEAYDLCLKRLGGGTLCTRPEGHHGRHVACDESVVVEIGPDPEVTREGSTGAASREPVPIVTHADLQTLRRLRNKDEHLREWSQKEIADTDVLLDRLIAAAEADAPTLPEGWYLWRDEHSGASTAVYVKGGRISRWDDGDGLFGQVIPGNRDRLTPLRSITEAEFRAAALAEIERRD